jgi:hypothetical protein
LIKGCRAFAQVAKLGEDSCSADVAGTWEERDLPIGQRLDEALDAPREVRDLLDQRLHHRHHGAHQLSSCLVGNRACEGRCGASGALAFSLSASRELPACKKVLDDGSTRG